MVLLQSGCPIFSKASCKVAGIRRLPSHGLNYLTCSVYIHLNAVQAGYVEKPEDWRYSSAPFYASTRESGGGESAGAVVFGVNDGALVVSKIQK
jgi:hypothetical protein